MVLLGRMGALRCAEMPQELLVVARADLAVHVRGGEHGLGHAFPDVVDCLPALKSEETQAKRMFSPASGPASAELAWSCCTKWTAVVEPGAATVGPSAPGTSSQAAAGTIAIPLKHASPTTQSLSNRRSHQSLVGETAKKILGVKTRPFKPPSNRRCFANAACNCLDTSLEPACRIHVSSLIRVLLAAEYDKAD